MPQIFDNIKRPLFSELRATLQAAYRADFCVGYFNLRGWRQLADCVEPWQSDQGQVCRLLIGMQGRPDEELRGYYTLRKDDPDMDQGKAKREMGRVAEAFRRQLTYGAPNNQDEAGLRTLVRQLKARQIVVKIYLRQPLHAKLYLLYRHDVNVKTVGYLGSSNLTMPGLSRQAELNVDVLDQPAAQDLSAWFEERWNDQYCYDISDELVQIIEASWARENLIPPYELYLKIAYHLSQEARAGLTEFHLPAKFDGLLFDYQQAAVQIAAHHLNKRGGVMLGDVVGLGKTLMATALASIFQEDQAFDTLILCPPNLTDMWTRYRREYDLIGDVLSLGKARTELPTLKRYRLVIIDESHNLRNRDGRTYNAVQDYIRVNESKVILLSATPFNMSFTDLSAQLRLFLDENADIGIRPETYLRKIGGELAFTARHQSPVRSIRAFEQSEEIDDWRDLMRLYLVRRTRSFIVDNYTQTDAQTGRHYLLMRDGRHMYFPQRIPKNVTFSIEEDDPYRRLYSDDVVNLINGLSLPRYGLGLYVSEKEAKRATDDEKKLLDNLGRAGKRLMGFSRTNLFKRLESSATSFVTSIERHIQRNELFIYALDNNLALPIGTLEVTSLDPRENDEGDVDDNTDQNDQAYHHESMRALYEQYGNYDTRFKWISPQFFQPTLRKALAEDVDNLRGVLNYAGAWNAAQDSKLTALIALLNHHAHEKVLIFSQFADTVTYLEYQLARVFGNAVGAATGSSLNPIELVRHFSPHSNKATIDPDLELRILVATDVLSEGQNLQDAAIVVNYDLPWAIVRLVQRAGRVDRIDQTAEQILCYSFLPADGVERIIRLRRRVRERLKQNGEVVGSDERFFEDDDLEAQLKDLYTEKSGILDADTDNEVDLASYAFQIWQNATKSDPALAARVAELPSSAYTARRYVGSAQYPPGVLTYMKTADGSDALAWVNDAGESITQSQLTILKAAECTPDEPALLRHPDHHALVSQAVDLMVQETASTAGALGRPNSVRRRLYARLNSYHDRLRKQPLLLETMPTFLGALSDAIDDVFRHPLRSMAADSVRRQLKAGIDDHALAELTISLRRDERLSLVQDTDESGEPVILCSLGLYNPE